MAWTNVEAYQVLYFLFFNMMLFFCWNCPTAPFFFFFFKSTEALSTNTGSETTKRREKEGENSPCALSLKSCFRANRNWNDRFTVVSSVSGFLWGAFVWLVEESLDGSSDFSLLMLRQWEILSLDCRFIVPLVSVSPPLSSPLHIKHTHKHT